MIKYKFKTNELTLNLPSMRIKSSFLIILFFFISTSNCIAQQLEKNGAKLPQNVEIKTLQGKKVQSSIIENNENPIIISFWATWCKPCIRELSAIADLYEDWQEETGVKLVAISIDDTRNSAKVAPFVYGKDWDYDVYLDENGAFKRALNVNNVPHTFLLNDKKEIVWQHNSYAPGDEYKLYKMILELVK